MVSSEEVDKSKTKRKLASVQEILEITPHPKANKKEVAKVLGWKVVINKGSFTQGEKIVYFEIDSHLPVKPWSERMSSKYYKVTTEKVQNQLSQGEIFPISILKTSDSFNPDDYPIGMDLTDLLGIVKYEKDADIKVPGIINNDKVFPDKLIERTDEPRIQSNQQYIEIFTGKPYYMTLKYDGVSGTYLIDGDEFYICSRNVRVPFQKDNMYSRVVIKHNLYDKLLKTGKRYAIQGEVYGPGVIKNLLEVNDIHFAVFTIKDIIDNRYLDMQELIDKCKELDLPMVKILEIGDAFKYTEDELKELAEGNYEGTNNPREGIVFRLQKNWFEDEEHRHSFKYVNDDFLTFNLKDTAKK